MAVRPEKASCQIVEYWWLNNSKADLNDDTKLHFKDVKGFTSFWLDYCPPNWPLR